MVERGTLVTAVDYKGRELRRRVWEDTGAGVLLCKEEEYQRALRDGDEARAAGFSKQAVIRTGGDDQQEA